MSTFAHDDYDHSERPRRGRPHKLDNDVLKSLMEAGTKLDIQTYNCTTSIQRHLHKIGMPYSTWDKTKNILG